MFLHLAPFCVVPVHWVALVDELELEEGYCDELCTVAAPAQQLVPTFLLCILQ
jgi:hypothetical protein